MLITTRPIRSAIVETISKYNYVSSGESQSTIDFLMHIIPDTVVGAFANGEILQVIGANFMTIFTMLKNTCAT
jgi:Na+/H+-dicarboxylate symporter